MAVPRNRTSNARKNSRRAHSAKKPLQLLTCTNCGKARRAHHICSSCGFYKNREVIKSEAE